VRINWGEEKGGKEKRRTSNPKTAKKCKVILFEDSKEGGGKKNGKGILGR